MVFSGATVITTSVTGDALIIELQIGKDLLVDNVLSIVVLIIDIEATILNNISIIIS